MSLYNSLVIEEVSNAKSDNVLQFLTFVLNLAHRFEHESRDIGIRTSIVIIDIVDEVIALLSADIADVINTSAVSNG